jgi:hypothetical protein
VQFIETAEKLPSGVFVKKPTDAVLRELILKQRWSGPTRLGLFLKYAELLAKVEKTAEEAIRFEPSDTDAEIERLESRLADLKSAREAKQSGLVSSVAGITKTIATESKTAPVQPPVQVAPAPQATPPPRQPVTPTMAPPPPQTSQPVRAGPQPTKDQVIPTATPAVEKNPNDYPDSFVDTSDDDGMTQAIAEENARLFALRQGRPLPEAPSALQGLRRPPHLAARETAQEFQPDGDVFRRPVEELTPRGELSGKGVPPNLNAAQPGKGTQNPRFRPGNGR